MSCRPPCDQHDWFELAPSLKRAVDGVARPELAGSVLARGLIPPRLGAVTLLLGYPQKTSDLAAQQGMIQHLMTEHCCPSLGQLLTAAVPPQVVAAGPGALPAPPPEQVHDRSVLDRPSGSQVL